MSEILTKIESDIISTMKERDIANQVKLSALKMAKAALQAEAKKRLRELNDPECQIVLESLIKKHKDSIEQFDKGGRSDLSLIERSQMTFIESYLPKEASLEQIQGSVSEVIKILSITKPTMKDFGKILKEIKQNLEEKKLRADSKTVSQVIKEEIEKV